MNRQTQFKPGEAKARLEKGFSLIELLIVVAIILIIAAIAIPNLVRSKIAANEASAVSTVRSITTAEMGYASTFGVGYGTLAVLGGADPCTAAAATACLLDPIVSAGSKSGYNIAAAPSGAGGVTFAGGASPIMVGISGQRTFCADETGVIRFDATGGATPLTDVGCQALPMIIGQ
jgi:type IV pilus assembly protein PilA